MTAARFPILLAFAALLVAGCASKTEATPAAVQQVNARKEEKG